jgi:glutathione synthase/RimK-type ligase-like ATP-grasp enzyme
MSEHILIVEKRSDWPDGFPQLPVVTAKEYLTGGDYPSERRLRIVNLCRSYRYGSLGYYCSLLAEARGHRVIPTVRTIQDLSRRSIYSLLTRELNRQVESAIDSKGLTTNTSRMQVAVFFGRSHYPELQEPAQQIYESFRAPLLRLDFKYKGGWRIAGIKPIPLKSLSGEEASAFVEALLGYMSKPWRNPRARKRYRYDLAILYDPQEKLPPSDGEALRRFVKAAKALDMDAEMIQKKDFGRIAEFDALFIRETTSIDHHTFRFARRAQNEGLVVIDDPDSILRCTNKVFLEELLRANRVQTPRTLILHKGQQKKLQQSLDFPIILKIPDGSFSRGVYKAENKRELKEICRKLFKTSDLILAQEYMYTDFDWRIGILDRKPLFVCKYLMSVGHWQIYDHNTDDQTDSGDFETLAVEDAPKKVVKTALRAARLIGNGLYGVDLKETSKGVFVIEVNDNPSIDADIEDKVLKEELYRRIMASFRTRLDQQRTG